MGVWYTTREAVKAALDSKETARNNTQIDAAIESASRMIDGQKPGDGFLHRRFYPELRTMTFDWPDREPGTPAWKLYLNQHELISASTITSGGVTIAAGDYFLRPDYGPPYTRIEIDLASSAAFGGGDTYQRNISITGVFGHSAEEATAGALAEALDTSETGIDATDSALIGVGQIIKVESERMLGVDVAGSVLTVKRAWDGSVLAAHAAAADIYASRRLTVIRGALGTTAATHADTTAIVKHVVPGLVSELCLAHALTTMGQRLSGYARTVGTGDNQRESSGRGLKQIRDDAYTAYGRKARSAAV